jgi:hypothetical protein
VKTKFAGIALGLVFLEACASGSTGYSPNGPAASNAATAARAPQKAPVPTFAISTQLPDAMRSHTSQTTVFSLRATTYVKTRKYVDVVNGAPCALGDSGNSVSGCGVVAEGTVSFVLRKGTFEFYNKAGGTGCVVAIGTYKGTITPQGTVPIAFKAAHTKKCWS